MPDAVTVVDAAAVAAGDRVAGGAADGNNDGESSSGSGGSWARSIPGQNRKKSAIMEKALYRVMKIRIAGFPGIRIPKELSLSIGYFRRNTTKRKYEFTSPRLFFVCKESFSLSVYARLEPVPKLHRNYTLMCF
jgi:hypothetical protein